MLVKINNNKFRSGVGNTFTAKEVKNAVNREIKRGFTMKDMRFDDAVCIKFNYDTNEIELLDKYYVVLADDISKRFADKEEAKEWANIMRYHHGMSCSLHKITKNNLEEKLEELEELLFEKIERRYMVQKGESAKHHALFNTRLKSLIQF